MSHDPVTEGKLFSNILYLCINTRTTHFFFSQEKMNAQVQEETDKRPKGKMRIPNFIMV